MIQLQQPAMSLNGQLVYQPIPNFSYSLIPFNCCLLIPIYQEMSLNRILRVEGKLFLQGNLFFVR